MCGVAGRACMLQRWAGKLFAHVCKVIKVAGLGSQIGMDYGTVLRTQLLLVPQYCAAASSITFQGKRASACVPAVSSAISTTHCNNVC